MRLVFLGTPDFAVPSLEKLAGSHHEVALVITQPDRPKGRGKKLVPPPVKVSAGRLGLQVAQLAKVSSAQGIELLESAAPDAGVVCAFGEIISAQVLAAAPRGFFNVHASLLPKFRGAAPVHHAILSGDRVTGVSIIRLTERMDDGDVAAMASVEIAPGETTGELTGRLAGLGAEVLLKVLDEVEAGTAVFEKQDDSKATFAPKVTKKQALIDWSCGSGYLERFVRAMAPEPGAFTFVERSGPPLRLIVRSAAVAEGEAEPGTVIEASGGRLVVAAGQGALELEEVQPSGKRAMSAAEFLRGYQLAPGRRFTSDAEH